MSTVTIPNLPAAGALTGTELLPVVQSGTTSNTTSQAIANLAGGIIAVGAGAGSTLRINNGNTASGCYSTVAGGGGCISGGCGGPTPNKSLGNFSTIGGGMSNTANGFAPTIAGGRNNTSGVVGRVVNTYDSFYSGSTLDGTFTSVSPSSTLSTSGSGATFNISFISGVLDTISIQNNGSDYVEGDLLTFNGDLFGGTTGVDNVILNINVGFTLYTTVGGGISNTASNTSSTVGGGTNNIASGNASTVGGGYRNCSTGNYSTVGGGTYNIASGCCSTVGGGKCSTASGIYSTLGGGRLNTSSGNYSTVGGGFVNLASGLLSTIGGGSSNTAGGNCSTIGGGVLNTSCNDATTVGGGSSNTASCNFSTVGGGQSNTASGTSCNSFTTIGGGRSNTASGNYSSILGGKNNSTNNCNDAMIIGSCITANRACTTFVNNLSIMDIPTSNPSITGAVWSDGGTLKISS